MKDRFLAPFAVLWTLLGCAYIAGITFVPLPQTGTRFADTTLGFLIGTAFSGILGYFYDSTAAHKAMTPPPVEPVPDPVIIQGKP